MQKPKWANLNQALGTLEVEWESSSMSQRIRLEAQRDYPSSFFIQRWGMITEQEKEIILARQTFPFSFLERVWRNSSRTIKYYIIKNQEDVPVEFIIEHWYELDSSTQLIAVLRQGFMDNISKEELPIFLANTNKFVRDKALHVYRIQKDD